MSAINKLWWKCFTKRDDYIAACNYCNSWFSYKSTTTNLKKHLVRKHNEEEEVAALCSKMMYLTERKTRAKPSFSIIFWSVQGLTSKQQGFWNYVEGFDIICLTETWVTADESDNWCLNEEYEWKWTPAMKTCLTRRVTGGMLTGVKKTIKERKMVDESRDDIQTRKIVMGNKTTWTVASVCSYGRSGMYERLEEIAGETENEFIVFGGNFNARIGESCGTSKDQICDYNGRRLLEFVDKNGLMKLNGNHRGDLEGEITYISRGEGSVVDYAVVGGTTAEHIHSVGVGSRSDAEHFPLEVSVGKPKKQYSTDSWFSDIRVMQPLQKAQQHLQKTLEKCRKGETPLTHYQIERRIYIAYERKVWEEITEHSADLLKDQHKLPNSEDFVEPRFRSTSDWEGFLQSVAQDLKTRRYQAKCLYCSEIFEGRLLYLRRHRVKCGLNPDSNKAPLDCGQIMHD